MTHLLYVEGSPRKQRSASIEVSEVAIAAWRAVEPDLTIDRLDVWDIDLPEFNGSIMEGKYAGLAGLQRTPEQERAWGSIHALASRFLAADAIIIAAPLWNFSIPYRLKHLIDVISQKDVLFTFDENGFGGLLAGRKALVVCARGLHYRPSSSTPAGSYDFQKPYIETWLRFVGIEAIETVIIEKTLSGADVDREARDTASAIAAGLVRARLAEAVGGPR
jgi:FMN-dependent NADH-azoreductase